jgi:uncharacterized protein YndB with AHSA1/START domain
MKSEPFVIERTYHAPVERVWKALTDKDQMKLWYFDVSGFKPEVGFEFSFQGNGSEGQKYTHLCVVKEVIPPKKLAYTWRYKAYEGDSLVTFELFSEGENTRLRLTHEGLETFPAGHPDFAKTSFAMGWTQLIGSLLKDFVEK